MAVTGVNQLMKDAETFKMEMHQKAMRTLYSNSSAILDAINFGENVSCGYNPNFKEYGVISFAYHGSRQVVPNYAVPKINSTLLSGICAKNNSLAENTNQKGTNYKWEMRKAGNILTALAQENGKVVDVNKKTQYGY